MVKANADYEPLVNAESTSSYDEESSEPNSNVYGSTNGYEKNDAVLLTASYGELKHLRHVGIFYGYFVLWVLRIL